MKLIRVILQSPWKATDSPYYKYLQKLPVEGIKYINTNNFKLIQNRRKLRFNNWLKQSIKRLIRRFFSDMPNAHYTPYKSRYDLIHCAHCISKNKSPWVCDIEFVGQFWASGHPKNFPSKKQVLKYIESDYCKKILAWSEWSKKGILKEFPEIKGKVEVLYPAISTKKKGENLSEGINLLFIGRDFYLKGGAIALEIFDRLTKKYEKVSATIVSDVPREVLGKYKNNKIKFYNLMSHEKLFGEIYPNADIFVYPTFSDTFGFAILEAQSFGLPVVATKTTSTHTIRETITEGKTGFIVENMKSKKYDEGIINEISGKVESLIKDKKLLKLMGKNAREEIMNGKFSVDRRNKNLGRVYKEALKK